MDSRQDFAFMARALQLARKGRYTVDPNPCVGCVLVRDGAVIGEGWHVRAGLAHAEINALADAGDARGATVYVTLEPCSHVGKTGPCCDALIAAGVARVVVAMQDPNPLVAGQGLQRLLAAGIQVSSGILAEDAAALNPGFVKRMTTGRPLLTSKLAMSLDGRTAMASGESQWITSTAARLDVHRLRAASSAVLTGINTVLADDPSLTARLDEDVEQPLRVVLDTALQIPVQAKMAGLPGKTMVLTASSDNAKCARLQQAGFEVYRLDTGKDKRLDLQQVLDFLGRQQLNSVLVEAGPVLNGALLSSRLVDRWIVYAAPCIMGDAARGLFHVPGLQAMADRVDLQLLDVRQVGPDLRLKFIVEN